MELSVLSVFAEEMQALNINHAAMEWRGNLVYPYFTSEYYENGYEYEDNSTVGEILLEGWTRNEWAELWKISDTIKQHFANFTKIKNNTGISITFLNAAPIRTGDIELKKIQIRLSVKSWKGI